MLRRACMRVGLNRERPCLHMCLLTLDAASHALRQAGSWALSALPSTSPSCMDCWPYVLDAQPPTPCCLHIHRHAQTPHQTQMHASIPPCIALLPWYGIAPHARRSSAHTRLPPGHHVIIVTSGAVGVGCQRLGLAQRPSQQAKRLALAAVGQVHLMKYYEDFLGALGLVRWRVVGSGAAWLGGQSREEEGEREKGPGDEGEAVASLHCHARNDWHALCQRCDPGHNTTSLKRAEAGC